MLNLQGLTPAQKMHVLKYGRDTEYVKPDAPQRTYDGHDELDDFMQGFQRLYESGLNPKEAWARSEHEYRELFGCGRYSSYQSFLAARTQYYNKRDRGPRPKITRHWVGFGARGAYEDTEYWEIVKATIPRHGRVKAWMAAEDRHKEVSGSTRYGTFRSFAHAWQQYKRYQKLNKA